MRDMIHRRRMLRSVLIASLAVLLSGCSMLEDAVVGGITGGAGRSAEQETERDSGSKTQPQSGEASAPAAGAQWDQYMGMQAQVAFTYSFSAGGMWAGQKEYKPGEYTKFELSVEGEEPLVMERAFLKELDDGTEWWRVSWDTPDGTFLWEALIDVDSGQILRMRARDAEGNTGEIPVSGQAVIIPSEEMTRDSVQGATVAKEKVTVPAGTFQSDHVVFSAPTGEGQAEFWLAPQIPGGVVKYLISDQGEEIVWTADLVEYGKQADTLLGSY